MWLPLLWLAACEEEGETIFEGPYHVRFTETGGSVVENFNFPQNSNLNQPVEVQLHLVAPQQGSETQISFEVTGSAVEGVDYQLLDGKTVTIPASESFGSFRFVPLNNREQDGIREAVFIITEVNNGLQIGRSAGGIIGRSATWEILDDDCLVDLRQFNGTWEIEETEGGDQQNASVFEYEVQIEADFDSNNQVIIKNFAGIEGAEVYLNLDMCQRQLIIPEQRVQGLGNNAGNIRTLEPGNFDEEAGRINFRFTMDALGNITRSITASRID